MGVVEAHGVENTSLTFAFQQVLRICTFIAMKVSLLGSELEFGGSLMFPVARRSTSLKSDT